MKWFRHKKLNTWEYEPYGFEPGKVYVMEISRDSFTSEQIDRLQRYFMKNHITVDLIRNDSQHRGLQPVELKRITEEAS